MTSRILLLLIILFPILGTLGHDFYLASQGPEEALMDNFKFSDLGWIWANYARQSHDWTATHMPAGMWDTLFVPVLSQTAILVAIVFSVLVGGLSYLLKITKKEKVEEKDDGPEFGFNLHAEIKRQSDTTKQRARFDKTK